MKGLRRKRESYEQMRQRLIRETQGFLALGMSHPEAFPHIPTVEVGKACFTRSYADAYWKDVAGIDPVMNYR